jgi:16S rRNA (adenine1518-N6/adenine1519-N6)-dimethyltransferase
MHFMLQKEVVDRLVAAPGSRNYGRLSVMCQYYCDAESLMDIAPDAFNPPPKVDSAIIRLTPKPVRADVDVALLSKVVACAFSQRRKTLANTLKPLIDRASLVQLGINPGARAEVLRLDEFITIANSLT